MFYIFIGLLDLKLKDKGSFLDDLLLFLFLGIASLRGRDLKPDE